MKIRVTIIILLAWLGMGLTVCAKDVKDPRLKKFEAEAWELRSDLLHNHTYELANIRKADSLYKKSVEMKSVMGRLYALQIRTYALAGNNMDDEFMKTVDEFIRLALDNKLYTEYFDAASAKIQHLIGRNEFTKSLFEAKDMVATAEKVNNLGGVYESNLLLGQIYKYRSSWLTAGKHLQKSLDAVNKMGKNDSIPYCLIYREMAEAYSGASKHAKALEYARMAKKWASYDVYRCFAEWTYLSVLYNSHDMKMFRNEYAKSPLRSHEVREMLSEELKLSLQVMVNVANGKYDEAKRLQLKFSTKGINRMGLSNIYYIEGDYKKAYDCLMEQQAAADSIENLLQQDVLSEMEARLGTATLRLEADEAKLRERQILMASISIMLVFVICTMVYMLRRRRKQNLALSAVNRAMEQKNRELTKAKKTTEDALIRAEKANAMRSHFIENMMHEIRTPLNAISGFTQVLANPDIPVEGDMAREMRDIIMTNTENLATMLDQIIHLSSYDSGSEDVTMTETSLAEIVDKAVELQSNSIKDGVQLVINTVDVNITTDGNLAAEALAALIHNAGKFTSEGSITVEAYVDGPKACIAVTDTGIGIDEDKAEKVFERFYKVDEFVPGTGLGLSLCRAIVTTLGGTVAMDTTHTAPGARFVITLPRY